MNNNNIEVMLDKLAETIRLGKKPLIGNGRIIDDMSALDIIAAVKEALPDSIAEARVIIGQRDALIEDANRAANDILAGAEREANRMLSENEIIVQAREQAQKIVDDATAYANNVIDQSYKQIANVMNGAEYYLRQTLDDVSASKQELFKLMSEPINRN
ncbi:MAG: hypothetical protein SO434_02370 [Eubacteriales bacterium]|nr:hypothetical protein [Eubacteriales bacterium]